MSFKVFPYIFILGIIISLIQYFLNEFEFYLQLDISLSLTIFLQKSDTVFEDRCAKYYLHKVIIIPNCYENYENNEIPKFLM